METLTVTFKTITPLFLGGADPTKHAELRAASIKGAMRFWYRAIDPEYRKHEDEIFGSADTGQGLFLLTLDRQILGSYTVKRDHYNGYNKVVKPDTCPEHSSNNNNSWTRNGNNYLGFSLSMNSNKAIPAGETFTMKLLFCNKVNLEESQKKILASIWLLGHIGGLGSRSRRGFGTIALQSWSVMNGWLKITDELPIAHVADSQEDWLAKFKKGLNKIKEWFPNNTHADHTIISDTPIFYLFNDGKSRETIQNKDYNPWEAAMDVAGKAMQQFRQRWDLTDLNSDYFRVKQHLLKKNPGAPTNNLLEKSLTDAM